MEQGSSSTLDAHPLLPSTAPPLGAPPTAALMLPGPDGWCKELFLFVHFTFPRKCDCSWLQSEEKPTVAAGNWRGQGKLGKEFLGSGPQPRSRSGKKVAQQEASGKDSCSPHPPAQLVHNGGHYRTWRGRGSLCGPPGASLPPPIPAPRSLQGPRYKETREETTHALLMNERL